MMYAFICIQRKEVDHQWSLKTHVNARCNLRLRAVHICSDE